MLNYTFEKFVAVMSPEPSLATRGVCTHDMHRMDVTMATVCKQRAQSQLIDLQEAAEQHRGGAKFDPRGLPLLLKDSFFECDETFNLRRLPKDVSDDKGGSKQKTQRAVEYVTL
jgi:hypothetical protein